MYNRKALKRVENIRRKIDFIDNIVQEHTSIADALEDVIRERLPIISRTVDKLLQEKET